MLTDVANILGASTRQDGQLEDNVHVHLSDNDEGVAVREGIQRRVDAALDGVFDRDDGAVGLAATHGRERLRGTRHGHEGRAGGSDLVDGLLGKRAEGAEEGDTKLVTEGRGAGNVRRHGVKGNESERSGAASFRGRGALWPIARLPRPGERQSREPVTPVAKASRPPPGVTSPHAVIFDSFAVPPASTSSKPVDVSTL